MTPEIEKAVYSRMDSYKSLLLSYRFELADASLSDSSRLMRQFSAVIGELRRIMNRIGSQIPMGNTVTSQLIRHDLPRLILMAIGQTPEEVLGGLAVSEIAEGFFIAANYGTPTPTARRFGLTMSSFTSRTLSVNR